MKDKIVVNININCNSCKNSCKQTNPCNKNKRKRPVFGTMLTP